MPQLQDGALVQPHYATALMNIAHTNTATIRGSRPLNKAYHMHLGDINLSQRAPLHLGNINLLTVDTFVNIQTAT